MQLTARDLSVMSAVARYRFLTSTQIAQLAGGSHQQILRRLQLLYHHGYLDRPRAQIVQLAHALDEGNRPFVYGLGRMGAQILSGAGASEIDRLDWTTKNARATARFLAHTIETAEAMIAFELACQGGDTPLLRDQPELLYYMPAATRVGRDPFRIRVSFTLPGYREILKIGVVPDRLFSLLVADDMRLNFALELDRGTMDIKSKRLVGKSSFRRKLLGYYNLWKSDRHQERWGFKSFRVLTITPSETRLEHMMAAQREIVGPTGSNLFLFTTPDRLAGRSPLADIWTTGRGATVTLLAGTGAKLPSTA